jgi:hypothetical protein
MSGLAIAQAVSRRLPTETGSGQVGFVVVKVALGQVSPSTSASPVNLHSINCSTLTLTYHLGLVQ